jgi:hypothetical protein
VTEINRRAVLGAGLTAVLSPSLMAAARSDRYLEAAVFAFPLFEMARLSANARGPRNVLNHRRTLSDYTSRAVTMPNNDTLYSAAWLDLSAGPIDLDVPLDTGRYLSVALMNAFTDNIIVISRRSHEGPVARIRIIGPSSSTKNLEGRTLIRSSTQDCWMLARTYVEGLADLASARAVQDQIKLVGIPVPPTGRTISLDDPESFIEAANRLLSRTDPAHPLVRRARRFSDIGLVARTEPVWLNLDETARAQWTAALAALSSAVRDSTRYARTIEGWSWPNGEIGNFGNSSGYRAAIARSGIGALPVSEALYLTAVQDDRGAPLASGKSYALKLPSNGVPVDAFWSLSAYRAEPDGRFFFTENPIDRYSIGSNAADVLTSKSPIIMSHQRPKNDKAIWLPLPYGPFRLVFRAYQPQLAFVRRNWRLPALKLVSD